MSNLLSVENLTMKFGGLIAIDDLSFKSPHYNKRTLLTQRCHWSEQKRS